MICKNCASYVSCLNRLNLEAKGKDSAGCWNADIFIRNSKGSYKSCCQGKVKYPEWEEGVKEINRLEGGNRGMDVYRCKYCKQYHIGHKGVY